MLVTLIRHAQIEPIYQGTYIGHLDVALSTEGIETAKKLCIKLDTLSFDRVFASDLTRSRETLNFSKYAKHALYTPLLREKSWGRHEGMDFNAIIASENIRYSTFKEWLAFLDGEAYDYFIKRVKAFFLEFLTSLHVKSTLVMTHAGVMRVLIMLVENISLEEAFSIKIEYAQSITLNLETMEIRR